MTQTKNKAELIEAINTGKDAAEYSGDWNDILYIPLHPAGKSFVAHRDNNYDTKVTVVECKTAAEAIEVVDARFKIIADRYYHADVDPDSI